MNQGSVLCRFLYLPLPLFLAKKKDNYFEVTTFGRSFFSLDRYFHDSFAITCEILSLLSEGRYFRNLMVTVEWIHLLSIRPRGGTRPIYFVIGKPR